MRRKRWIAYWTDGWEVVDRIVLVAGLDEILALIAPYHRMMQDSYPDAREELEAMQSMDRW